MAFDFQDVHPNSLVLFTVLYAESLAESLPFNVQEVLGNVLELMGQVLLAYNAQQQFFEGGPGRFYSAKNRNADNPFCSDNQADSSCSFGEVPDPEYVMELAKRISRDIGRAFI